MKYALLINERDGAVAQLNDDERAAYTAEYVELVHAPRVLGSEQLHPATTATTRTGMGRLTYPVSTTSRLLINTTSEPSAL